MKQNKTLKINTVTKDVGNLINKLLVEIEDLEKSLEDKKILLEELNNVRKDLLEN